jgi:hypothetical protein
MSILARPSVVFAIVFACFAVLIPKVFLPIFRSKPTAPSHNNFDDRKLVIHSNIFNFFSKDFRRPHPAMARTDNGDTIEHIPVGFIQYLKTFVNEFPFRVLHHICVVHIQV